MGLRGPKPKPTAMKIAAGNPGRRKLNDGEPVPPVGEILPPEWLGPEALKIWEQLAPLCIAMKVLTTVDVNAFARYCVDLARWIELKRFVWQKGAAGTTYTRKDAKGKVYHVAEIPQAIELRQLDRIIMAHEAQFGLTPSARSRLRIEAAAGAAASVAPASTPDQVARSEEIRKLFAGGGPAPPRGVAGA